MKVCSFSGRLALLTTLALVALCVVALPATADEATATQLSPAHATLWNGPPVLGTEMGLPADSMRAAIDQKTGELRRPTTTEARILDALAAPTVQRIFAASQVERADGTVMMAVDPELLNYTLVHVDDVGNPAFLCVDGPTQADSLVRSTPAPAVEVK
jgi:hypothetical protein